jgi:hypothetical protein
MLLRIPKLGSDRRKREYLLQPLLLHPLLLHSLPGPLFLVHLSGVEHAQQLSPSLFPSRLAGAALLMLGFSR